MGYALTGVAFLSALPVAKRASSERHPCESCACGCSSAAFCWDKCCCHTDVQKLEWAARNGVEPPEFLVDRVAEQQQRESQRLAKQSISSCCAKKSAPKSCCSAKDSPACSHDDTKDDLKIVLMWKAAECRGLKYMWASLAEVYIAPVALVLESEPRLIQWLIVSNQLAVSPKHRPDPPIP